MRRENRHILYMMSGLVDALLIVACFVAVSQIRVGTSVGVEEANRQLWFDYAPYVISAYALVMVACYALMHVYGDVFYGRVRRMATSIALVNTVGVLAFGAGLYIIRLEDFSRLTLLWFYLASTVAVILKQWLVIQALYYWRRTRRVSTPVLLVGSGRLAREYARTIGGDVTRHEQIVGYVAPRAEAGGAAVAASGAVGGAGTDGGDESELLMGECLGSIGELDEILAGGNFGQLIVALEAEEYALAPKVMALADKHGVYVRLVPFFNDLIPRNPAIESIHDLKLIDVRTTALDNLFLTAGKRAFDVVVSALILLLISPVMVVVAIGVRLSSPGPVFFRQERVGKDRKPFMMLKFRSMRVNADADTAWSTDEDPRKTKFGSFIRKYSIDELPQFINVLKGDMSIVGPRPEIPHYVRRFAEEVPLYMLRHQVRPGITGWAQVNGLRGDTSIEERVKYDLYYIEHWSPWFDLRIFLRTIFGGFANSEKVVK